MRAVSLPLSAAARQQLGQDLVRGVFAAMMDACVWFSCLLSWRELSALCDDLGLRVAVCCSITTSLLVVRVAFLYHLLPVEPDRRSHFDLVPFSRARLFFVALTGGAGDGGRRRSGVGAAAAGAGTQSPLLCFVLFCLHFDADFFRALALFVCGGACSHRSLLAACSIATFPLAGLLALWLAVSVWPGSLRR